MRQILQNIWAIFFQISLNLLLITKAYIGHCNGHFEWKYDVTCDISGEQQLSEGYIAFLLFSPMLLSMIVKNINSEVIFLSWFMNLTCIIVIVTVYDLYFAYVAICVFGLLTFLALYEYQRQKISMFFLSQDLQGVETQNERLAKENQASELKHLIGNVAHDLKTVF